MKTTHIILAAIIAATSAVQAATAEHKLPAPMPEFMSQEQVTKWQADRIAKAQAKKSAETAATLANSVPAVFYTGKPYLEETGSYAFMFRNYSPELSRWTTIDPSGYPNGANNMLYVSNNTLSTLDTYGLFDSGTFTKGAAQFAGGIGLIVGGTALLGGAETILPAALGTAGILTGVFTLNSGILNMGAAWNDQTTWIPTTTSGMVTTTLSLMVGSSMSSSELLGSWADTFENSFWALIPGSTDISAQLRRASASLNVISGQLNTHRDFIPATNANGENGYE